MFKFRVLLIEEEGGWAAQILERDIVCQAETVEALLPELERVVRAHVELSVELGLEPFANIGPAPQEFFDLWEQGIAALQPLRWDTSEPALLREPELRVGALVPA
jgi:hypothetical protein